MSDSEMPTNPHIVITKEDILAHLLGTLQRLEVDVASINFKLEEIGNILKPITSRINQLEHNCKMQHSNGSKYL